MMNTLSRFWRKLFGEANEDNERYVTSRKALSLPAVWNGVSRIAGHISQLPVHVYQRVEGGGEKLRDHPISRLLRSPNPYQNAIQFQHQMAVHAILEGNARAAIVRRGSRIQELIPLHPECTATGMIAGVKVHATRPPREDRLRLFFDDIHDRRDTEAEIMLTDDEVVHVVGLSMDGVIGLSLIDVAKHVFNTSLAADKRFASQMSKGFTGSIFITAPPNMFRDEASSNAFLEQFKTKHHDKDKAGEPGLLREGMTAQILSPSNKDTEMLDARKFERQNLALLLCLEQIMGDDDSVSYNSLAEKNLSYQQNCLNPWIVRNEQEFGRKLLTRKEWDNDTHYLKYNMAALHRADIKTTAEAFSTLITARVVNPNEAREKLDLLPYEGGDEYSNPAITPGQGGEPESTEGSDSTEDEADPQSRRAVVARLEHLIGVESKRVTQAVSKTKNYVEWVDKFYAKNWEPKLADWLEELGLDRGAATAHCEESKQKLLDVCDYSAPEELQSNIAKCVSTWRHRAAGIGNGQLV